ncbi:MAG TPA: M56 family metallopeptidase [Pyrinomonadaceae bacterium]|nr:M56 family metallopeptidase [Pyrinomonadaceae bacterium]
MYLVLGLCILLAAMLLINSIASFAISIVWRGMSKLARGWSPATRASVITTIRVVPVVMGLATVALLFAPAYLTYEPRNDHEDISLKLALVAAFSAVGIILAVLRGALAWRATARLSKDWLARSQPVRLSGIGIPTYQIEHEFPVIAIVGTVRPRLFVATRVLQSLSNDELNAAISHEAGHLVHGDNLKRTLLRICRDSLLIIPAGRSLDVAWKEASEEAADDFAARRGSNAALDLASSLVKISRMIPLGKQAAMPAAAFLIGPEDGGGVTNRVRRLVNLAHDDPGSGRFGRVPKLFTWLPVALILVVGVASSEPHVLALTHYLIEDVVAFLK